MSCPSCGTENREGAKFCVRCGAALSSACPTCGAAFQAGDVFCGECGSQLGQTAAASAAPSPPAREAPASERRLVSVMFADLVGFTTVSESRDSEEVRELLSRYFELARELVGRYGGAVEKFIGDAVMAVWGTPTATEDDAERAVRAALDLVESVPDLDPALQARAGVLTGEAAVTIGAEGQGMVAGDLVNTASRVQSSADPGSVLVGETTRRTTEQAIAYEEAGLHELKGKTEPVALFRALRVVSGRAGALKSVGLEAPFVGRERELKLIKELFHASAHDRRAHLVSVTGIAGIGKSRLAWEFYKYFDGIVENIWWHRGRCLAYGEGVAYWALADMVRMRCRMAEDEQPNRAREKLDATLAEHLLDVEERRFVEPRLAHLLGLEEHRDTSARTCSPPGGSSSSAWPTRTRSCSLSRTCSGRTLACSTSSSTCSSGHATIPCTWSHSPGRSCKSVGPDGVPGSATSPRCTSSRSPRKRWRSCSTAWCRASRGSCGRRSSPGPKACRSTQSRPCGCCSTAAC
jgi:class 3 adenylate cyclase